MFISTQLGPIVPAVGASGSLYGLFFGFIMINPDRKIMMFPIFIPIKAKIIGIGLIVISVYFGFTGSDGIAHFAHLGGGIMGMILVKFGERTQIFNIARKHIRYGLPSQEGPQGQAQYPNPNYNYDAPKQHSVS